MGVQIRGKFEGENILSAVIALISALIVIIPFLYFTANYHEKSDAVIMDSGWNLSINGEHYYDVTLSKFVFPNTNRGDVVELTRVLDADTAARNPVLRLYSIHSVVEVYLNESQIYFYGREEYKQNKLLGYGYQYISLPNDYVGKQIRIVLTVAENNAFRGIEQMEINNERDMLQESISKDRFRMSIAFFLIVFGILASVVIPFMIIQRREFAQFQCIAICSLLVGCWTLCNNDLISYFVQNLRVKVFMEYLCIYALPLPLLGYFYDRIKRGHSVVFRYIYWGLVFLQSSLLTVSLVTQWTNIVHLPCYLRVSHLLMGIEMLYILLLAVDSIYRHRKIDRTVQIGMILAIVVTLIELIRYNLDKYFIGFVGNRYNSTLCFAALIIILALLLDYTRQIKNGIYQKAQQQLLQDLAYTDELTGLLNRRKCDEEVEHLLAAKHNFTLISMDLNLLKFYNDHYGHEKGDLLLKTFADILKSAFPDPIVKARTGGDEFVIVVPYTGKHMEKMLNQMYVTIEKTNTEDMKISVAVGYVVRSEFREAVDMQKLINVADQRMYENKRAMKQERNNIYL